MIIRSGLIRNRDGVDFQEFTQHWKNVHGPLVVKIDGLRAYSQNHVVDRIATGQAIGLHRVDGISQLYFDDVEQMKTAMASPEQEACIVDLRGFLSDVTLLIQQAGSFQVIGKAADWSVKLLYLLHGQPKAIETLGQAIQAAFEDSDESARFRINPIIARDIVVDQSITAGEQIVDAVLEVWTLDLASSSRAKSIVADAEGVEIIAGFQVNETVVLKQR